MTVMWHHQKVQVKGLRLNMNTIEPY